MDGATPEEVAELLEQLSVARGHLDREPEPQPRMPVGVGG